jgi:nucleoside 2-deoxyribosyltransferase
MIDHCPVCRIAQFEIIGEHEQGNQFDIKCARCGPYVIGKMAIFRLNAEAAPAPLLSGWIRQMEIHGMEAPTILQENLEQIRQWLPSFSVSDRTVELLRSLATLSQHPGAAYQGNVHADVSLAWAENDDEFQFHLGTLQLRGVVSLEMRAQGNYRASLTAEGWEQVERGSALILPRGFVAMSFAGSMLPAWIDGLKPGIEAAGYAAHRVDTEPHVQRIDQKIVADIRTSQFVVVDVTEQKQGAYFEAGLALGFGKTVIWTVREDDLKNVHFDTRQYAHIVWKDTAQLAQTLRDVIVAVLGMGPRRIEKG